MKGKKLKPIIIVTLIAGINLLVSGKVYGQITKNQSVNIQVSAGTIYVVPPVSINFPRTILNNGTVTPVTTNFAANSSDQKIMVVDEGRGDTFSLEASIDNLSSSTGSIPFSDVGMLSLNQNSPDTVDTASFNNPAGTNNVIAPLDYNYNVDETMPRQIPDTGFNFFTGTSLESDPVVLIQRTVAVPNSIGDYSVVPEFRVNIPNGTPGENFSGSLTLTLTSPLP